MGRGTVILDRSDNTMTVIRRDGTSKQYDLTAQTIHTLALAFAIMSTMIRITESYAVYSVTVDQLDQIMEYL
jgi:hypothetical protein